MRFPVNCGWCLTGTLYVPYWFAPGRRIVLLTVFRKTRMREAAEVERAQQAQKICEAEHGQAQHTYDRVREA
ncbi:hypothetical protein GCM10009716_18160 [Streptomyces sodiiphilus]|uniref:Uncharacterized protein n=1 Tax=Streptomyces sodiiphilus TaxID=226217 RepID=A0ABP5AAM8_9ACTN